MLRILAPPQINGNLQAGKRKSSSLKCMASGPDSLPEKKPASLSINKNVKQALCQNSTSQYGSLSVLPNFTLRECINYVVNIRLFH